MMLRTESCDRAEVDPKLLRQVVLLIRNHVARRLDKLHNGIVVGRFQRIDESVRCDQRL